MSVPEFAPPQDSPPSQCTATAKTGKRCRAKAIGGGDLCRAHSMTAEELASMRALSHQSRRERAERKEAVLESARMGTKERMARFVEEQQELLEGAYREALETGSPEALRKAQAAELALSRVYGRPAQPVEEQPRANPLLEAFSQLTPEERRAMLKGLSPPAHVLPTGTDGA